MSGFRIVEVSFAEPQSFREAAEATGPRWRVAHVARWSWQQELRFPTNDEILDVINQAAEAGIRLEQIQGVNCHGSLYGVEVT